MSNNDVNMYELMLSLILDMNNSRPVQMINNKYPELYDWIFQITPRLLEQELINGNDFHFDLSTRCRWIMSGRSDFPICRFCHQQFGLIRNLPIRYDYSEWCSNKCRQTDPLIVARTKATKLKNHGDENYCNPEKAKQTFLTNYGVTNPNKCKATREKIEQTCLDTYGYCVASQAPEIKEKIKQTNLEVRGVTSPLADPKVRQKGKETSWRVYGTEFPASSDIVKQHVKEGFIKHYGVDNNMKSPEGYKVWQQAIINKYGVDNPMKSDICKEHAKQTCLSCYGYEYVLQVPEVKEKRKQTCLANYGVEYISQSHDIRIKQCQRYFYNTCYFDSAPEIAFYIWLKDMNISFEYQPESSFNYEYAGKLHKYYPDFKIGDMYFEIKGNHFFKNGKMICPYRSKHMTDEQYKVLCENYEAKHQCMLKNDVIILKHAEYCIFLCYVSQTYGKNYLKQFRVNKKDN